MVSSVGGIRVLGSLVFGSVACISKLRATVLTFIGLLPGVDALVFSKVIALGKCLTAAFVLTFKGPLPGVGRW